MTPPTKNTELINYNHFLIQYRDYFVLRSLEDQFSSISNRIEINNNRVTRLDLSGFNLINFPSSIHRLSNLISINLMNTRLDRLPKSIHFLHKLRYLNISQNNIRSIPEWFGRVKYLETFCANDNPLVNLPNSLIKLKNLRKLELESTRLQLLPESIYHLPQLEILLIKGSPIQQLDPKIGKIKHLYQVNNTILPQSMNSLPIYEKWAIWELALVGNPQLQTSNDNVISIQMNRQRLKQIPSSIGKLRYLQILILAENQLSGIPSTIGDLHELRKLDLSFNSISTLPSNLSHLVNLEDCDFTWNPLYKLPNWFNQLKNLKRLYLTGTMIQDFNELLQCVNLTVLYLDSNELYELTTDFSQFLNLEYLVLSYNHLGAIPDSIQKIPNLKYLRINLNQISNIPEWISSMLKLELLDVSDNHLEWLPPSLGDHQSLTELFLDGNPWHNFIRNHILGYQNIQSDDNLIDSFQNSESLNNINREFEEDIDPNLFNNNESEIWDEVDEWGDFDPENTEFDLLIDDTSGYFDQTNNLLSSQHQFQHQTKHILENLRRLKNHITNLHNKIMNNIALDAFDQEFPDYAKYTGSLLEYCKRYKTETSRAVYELLQRSGLVKLGNFGIWL